MENETETKVKGFKRAYGKLDHDDAKIVRDVMVQRTGWSQSSFDQKRKGLRGLTISEIDTVKATFKNFGLDYETGEPLN